jgi:hypothetical protein
MKLADTLCNPSGKDGYNFKTGRPLLPAKIVGGMIGVHVPFFA